MLKTPLIALLMSLILLAHDALAQSALFESARNLAAGRSIKLTILHPEGSESNIQPLAERFQEQTQIKVELLPTHVDDINTRMMLGVLSKRTEYDLALPATFGIPDLVEAGALADLSAFAAKYEKQFDFKPSLYPHGNEYKGRKYGYQTDGDVYMMFYHRAWLEDPKEQAAFKQQYGRNLTLPNSWQELDQLLAFFHRPEQGRYGGALFRTPRYMAWEWLVRFHALGGVPFDEHLQPGIASKAGVQALQDLINATAYQHPSVKTNGLVDNWKLFAEGHCFANIGWGGTQKYLNRAETAMRNQVIPAPTPEVSYFNWGWNYVVSAYSPEQELAYLFALYAVSSEASIEAVKQDGFFDPFRPEHYANPDIQTAYSTAFLEAHQQSLSRAIPDLYIEGRGRYIESLEEAIVAAIEGHVNAEEALTYAAREWNSISQQIGVKKQLEQWHLLKSKYPANAP